MDKTTMQTQEARKTHLIISMLLNLLIVGLELCGLVLSIQNNGVGLFQFYTEDSNLFALVACAVYAGACLYALKKGTDAPPVWAKMLKYMATCCLTVTFLVVIFVLAPMMGQGWQGYKTFVFGGSMLYHHFLCPIVAMVSFLFFEKEPPLSRRSALYALLPTVVYAAVATVLNLLRIMDGPYPFLHVYEQPIYMSCVWCVLIVGGAYGVAVLLRRANVKKDAPKDAKQGGK